MFGTLQQCGGVHSGNIGYTAAIWWGTVHCSNIWWVHCSCGVQSNFWVKPHCSLIVTSLGLSWNLDHIIQAEGIEPLFSGPPQPIVLYLAANICVQSGENM